VPGTPIERLAEGVEAGLLVAVPRVFQHQQRLVEENRFCLGLRHPQPDLQRIRRACTRLSGSEKMTQIMTLRDHSCFNV
jgi:hypothetical protein